MADKFLDGAGLNTVKEWVKSVASKVSFSRDQASGTKIGTITIDSVSTDIYAPSGSSVTVDSALSTTSENPVQNKVITNTLRGLLYSTHKQIISSSTTIASKSETDLITVATDTIAGYTPIFVSPRNSGGASLHFRRLYLDGTDIKFNIGNASSSSVSTSAAYVNVLYARNDSITNNADITSY